MISIPAHKAISLKTKHLGNPFWLFDSIDSTNSLALCLAQDPNNHGLALLAAEQSSGRGQYGRVWTAPPGSSVLLSVLIFPPASLRRPALLTAWAAVAVCETIQEVAGLRAHIKWPNDVLVGNKKVCGILIEQRNTGQPESPWAAAVGIGLNVRQDADFFHRTELPLASSLATLSGQDFETLMVARRLLEILDSTYDRLLQDGAAPLETAWQDRLGLTGKPVRLETIDRHVTGRLLEVTLAGICVEAEGEIILLPPESIRHIHLAAD
jgi:BirA family transcriptional regulator, biotin operon repressor / biotin---[acetyl-CoA-carboxylase] ligase